MRPFPKFQFLKFRLLKITLIQDNRTNTWHVGYVVEMKNNLKIHAPEQPSYYGHRNYELYCLAFASDGTKLYAKSHNHHVRSEKDNPEMLKSEYFVNAIDDGTYWTEWSDWSTCSMTCGVAGVAVGLFKAL